MNMTHVPGQKFEIKELETGISMISSAEVYNNLEKVSYAGVR
jgi:hypothetical protein